MHKLTAESVAHLKNNTTTIINNNTNNNNKQQQRRRGQRQQQGANSPPMEVSCFDQACHLLKISRSTVALDRMVPPLINLSHGGVPPRNQVPALGNR
eukprot:CAMPEP_0203947996 /NCGR_PEP_ID=MMETSP0359-20131031/82785_1 /ASSEMBLY_ACC=CAM_ASM_000338 /TAXON_ID=268821 /ORGANISM="Scrippsiella Hangoei, Strain SHTV-5" /LENGTH=96 /DNA_ID=CAMNT_0050879471 /DNA_START=128 /DNA_END=415 /DNA_ORIENTATION=+